MVRCMCKTRKKLRCKNSVCAFSRCWSHLNQNCCKQILLIQNLWRCYRTRKIYNNIFLKLPQELQHKVIFHIRENFLIKKYHHNVIQGIMHNKIKETLKPFSPPHPPIPITLDILISLTLLYKLCNKYFITLKLNDINILKYKGENLSYILERVFIPDDQIELKKIFLVTK